MRALHGVLELADVARPVVVDQQPERALRELADLLADLLRQALDEGVGEQGDVLAALAQGRDADVDHVEPVEQVVAERAGRDRLLEVDPRGRDHPHVDAHLLAAADAEERALLQDAEQVDLELRRDVADLVEEERSAARPARTCRACAPSRP